MILPWYSCYDSYLVSSLLFLRHLPIEFHSSLIFDFVSGCIKSVIASSRF